MAEDVKLQLKIENSVPLELGMLAQSLGALAQNYEIFLANHPQYGSGEFADKLYVEKMSQGSLIIDILSKITPLVKELNSVFAFATFIQKIMEGFKKNSRHLIEIMTKKELDNLRKFIEPIARDDKSKLSININYINGNNNTVKLLSTVDSREANEIQKKIEKRQLTLKEEKIEIHKKVPMYWSYANFNQNRKKRVDGKVVIESILEKRSIKVIFATDEDKLKCTSTFLGEAYFEKDWQDLIYVVDVEVIRIQGRISLYKVLHVYYDETFAIEESELSL